MFQNFYCYEIYFGYLSFCNVVPKTVCVALNYEKNPKFCVLGFFFLLLTKYFWVITDVTRTIITIITICHCHCY